jgi:hypothetical protein
MLQNYEAMEIPAPYIDFLRIFIRALARRLTHTLSIGNIH